MTVADLKLGQSAVITNFSATNHLKLLDMGCVPGNTIKIIHIGLGGSPIAVLLQDYFLALRLSEASQIEVTQL